VLSSVELRHINYGEFRGHRSLSFCSRFYSSSEYTRRVPWRTSNNATTICVFLQMLWRCWKTCSVASLVRTKTRTKYVRNRSQEVEKFIDFILNFILVSYLDLKWPRMTFSFYFIRYQNCQHHILKTNDAKWSTAQEHQTINFLSTRRSKVKVTRGRSRSTRKVTRPKG